MFAYYGCCMLGIGVAHRGRGSAAYLHDMIVNSSWITFSFIGEPRSRLLTSLTVNHRQYLQA